MTVTVNGKDYTANVVNGRATVSVSNLKAGNYDVVPKYSGDNYYNAAVATSSFTAVSYKHLDVYKRQVI